MTGEASQDLGVINQRVSSLERDVTSILDKVDLQRRETERQFESLREAFTASRSPQWHLLLQLIGVAVIVIGALWAAGISPIEKGLHAVGERAEVTAAEVDALREDTLNEADYNAQRLVARQDNDNRFRRFEDDQRLLWQEMRDGFAMQVQRGELEERWRATDNDLANHQRQIEELKASIGGIYGARDVIADLQQRLRRIEEATP